MFSLHGDMSIGTAVSHRGTGSLASSIGTGGSAPAATVECRGKTSTRIVAFHEILIAIGG